MINYNVASKTYDHTGSPPMRSSRILRAESHSQPRLPFWVSLRNGNYVNALQLAFGSRCCGVEPSEGMRARAAAKNRSLDVRQGDHRKIPFDAEAFDFAFMTDVIHHVAIWL